MSNVRVKAMDFDYSYFVPQLAKITTLFPKREVDSKESHRYT